MKNKKIIKKLIVAVMIFSMVAMYGYMPIARAVSLTAASDTITDSDAGVSLVTHTVTFTTGQDLTAGYMIDLDFQAGVILTTATSTCPANSTGSIAGQVVTCTVNTGQTLGAGAYTITVASTTNPGTGSYTIDVLTETDASVEVEKVQIRFFIIDDITVHAHVDSTLEFVVSGVASSTALNGTFLCNALTTATTTDFGTLVPGVAKTICQKLQVTTNATIGFNVTVEQDNELENTTGDNINSFNNSPDGTGSTTIAEAWAIPMGILDADHTYGHLGVTSNDTDLSSGTGFHDLYNALDTPHYVGLDAANPQEVMHHNGPADGSTQDKGEVMVGYTAEINALQQAGDYTNTLTYIATATY